MGELQLFNINEIKNKYNLDIFIETGTGDATSLKHVIDNSNFENYFSVEIYKPLADLAKEKFKNKNNVEIINENSSDGLTSILKKIETHKKILFWLDAHFPGADFGGPNTYKSITEKHLRIPLENEIEIIKEHRKDCLDFYIIDDLRIYEDGNYEAGNWEDRKLYGGDGIQFIYDSFNKTHEIKKIYNHQGYILLIPKEV